MEHIIKQWTKNLTSRKLLNQMTKKNHDNIVALNLGSQNDFNDLADYI